jgi:hypothetical protein
VNIGAAKVNELMLFVAATVGIWGLITARRTASCAPIITCWILIAHRFGMQLFDPSSKGIYFPGVDM